MRQSLLNGIVAMVLVVNVHATANEPLVGRRTDSVDSDLISELLSRGMIATARTICELHLRDSQAFDDEHVRWLIELSRIKTAAILREDSADTQEKSVVTDNLTDAFLANHPDHERALWLRYQTELEQFAVTRKDVLAAMVRSPEDPQREETLKQIVRVNVRLRELSEAIENKIAIVRRNDSDNVRTQELLSLALSVASKRIESIMLRGDMFAAGSDDYVASANESLSASQELVDSLPSNAPARSSLVQHLAESLRRLKEFDRASAVIEKEMARDPSDAVSRAIAAHIALDQNDVAKSKTILSQGDESTHLELDLARLRLMLVSESENGTNVDRRKIGDRIQSIGKQHGAYARRLAEQLVLGTGFDSSESSRDPRLLIAQAASRVREGKPEVAGQFLAAATRQANDSADAIQLAIAGAAAFREAKNNLNASALLRETALLHFKDPQAPKLHLQAGALIAGDASPELIIEHLEETLETWPADAIAPSAVKWLVQIHEARGDLLAAARATTSADSSTLDAENTKQLTRVWERALIRIPVTEREVIVDEVLAYLAKSKTEAAAEAVFRLAILFDDAASAKRYENLAASDPWINSLSKLRLGGGVESAEAVDAVEMDIQIAAAERLRLDGQTSAINRKNLALAILQLVNDSSSATTLQAHLWLGNWPRAETIVNEIRKQKPNDPRTVSELAALLASSGIKEAKLLALQLWTTLSSQLPMGSVQWHEAKLALIRTLQAAGERQQARQVAQYVLLTQPPTDAELLQQYRSVQ